MPEVLSPGSLRFPAIQPIGRFSHEVVLAQPIRTSRSPR